MYAVSDIRCQPIPHTTRIRVSFDLDLERILGREVADVAAGMAEYLRQQGWYLEHPDAQEYHDWETPSQCAARLGVTHSTLSRKLASPDCPPVVKERTRGGKRLIRLASTPAFEAFCRDRKPYVRGLGPRGKVSQ